MADTLGGPYPPVRTFKPRRRTLSAVRADAMARLAPQWSVDEVGPVLDLVALFGRRAPFVVEIGIGGGEALIEMASADPTTCVIGCDVHTPGIAAALEAIEIRGLTNVRVLQGDAVEFLARIAPGALAGVRIFFPDPWPKVRHHHRRIVRDGIVGALITRLAPGGWIHLATDIGHYAEQMQRVCDARPELTGGVIPRPADRPVTRYEHRGLDAGHTVTDLWYVTAPHVQVVSDTT